MLMAAKARVNDTSTRSEGVLRRATSDLYYALFHAICEALVEPLIGGNPESQAFKIAFEGVYRQVRHEQAEKRCRSVATGEEFNVELRRFAKHFVTMKNKREVADYHPLERFSITVVKNDIGFTETRLQAFWATSPSERAAFACHVGLRNS